MRTVDVSGCKMKNSVILGGGGTSPEWILMKLVSNRTFSGGWGQSHPSISP
jgi:hypothetical protein